ncbi:Scr1 family TA system antitoxin-like transcriptional regulator [Streptomyces olivaceus]|uniref:Scr1 family TA system antitoxin-like transcriptional regulator n=1 Tax=Streptomyces olivaceus TaxID=47716 RepID=UPI00371AB19B
MCAAVWEAALRQLIGDSSIMRGQLEHLLDVAGLKNVRLQKLPGVVEAAPRQSAE